MVRWSSDRSFMVDPLSYFRSSQCSTTELTKAVVCAILSRRLKDPLLLIEKSNLCCGGSWFPLSLSGPLP